MRRYRTINITKNGKEFTVAIDGFGRRMRKKDLKKFFKKEMYLSVTARNFCGEIIFIEERNDD